jgi:hypothetical protein
VVLYPFCLSDGVPAITLAAKLDLHGGRVGRDKVDGGGAGEGGDCDEDHGLEDVSAGKE